MQLVKAICICLTLFALASCSQQDVRQEVIGTELTNTKENKERSFYPEPNQKQRLAIEKAKHMYAIFKTERVVRLRHTEHNIIGNVDQAITSGNSIIILDEQQRSVFRYDHEGHFQGLIGARGQGPGEYEFPSWIRSIWGEQIAVLDNQGKLLVYNEMGEHQFTIGQGVTIDMPPTSFEWSRQDRFFSIAYRTISDNKFVKIYDLSDLDNPITINTFDERPPFLEKTGFSWAYDAFALVDDKVWSANPYQGHIDVWDLQGKEQKQIKLGRDLIDYDYVKEMAEKYKHKRVLDKEKIFGLFQVGGVVVVRTTKGYQVLSRDGEALTGLMPFTCSIVGTHLDQLVTVIDGGDREINREVLPSGLKAEYAMMVDQGYTLESGEDEYYLLFGSLPTP